MQARLKVLHDKSNVKQIKLLPVTLIGRSTECNLKIASSQVSRSHCRITVGDDAVFVEDLGSANGTLVDGQLLASHQPTAIAPGARLVVGPAEFQIDYVASTSATMVLSRSGVPPIPDLPSTEMIFPENPAPSAAAQTLVRGEEIPAVFAPDKATVVAEDLAPDPVNVVPAAADVAPLTAAVSAAESPAVAGDRSSDTPFREGGLDFGIGANPASTDEATQFMFQETVPDAISLEDTARTAPSEQTPKKGGLKSLFSIFGRKDKPAADGVTHQASAVVAPATAPSIFLPTMEAQAQVATKVVPAEPIGSVNVDTVSAGTETADFSANSTSETPTDEEGDFQQFLSQL